MTSSGHIYKIICTLDEKFCYIGSTFNRLSKRFEMHRRAYKSWKKECGGACTCFTYFDKYGVENFKIILIKTYEVCRSHVKDRKHLEAYETLWINKTKCVNKYPAFNPLHKNKRFNNIRHKMRYLGDHEKRKSRNIKNRDERIAKMKEYRAKNRDEINARQREYRDKKRDEINAKRRAKRQAKKEAQITV